MAISTEQKLDNFRNMRAMISDYAEKYNRFPTIEEFEEGLNMAQNTVLRYKKVILEENRKKMLDEFQSDMIVRMNKTIKSIDNGIEKLNTISEEGKFDSDKITAIKGIVELNIDVISIMRDGPDFLKSDDNYVSDKQEYIYKEIQSEKITDSIESTFS